MTALRTLRQAAAPAILGLGLLAAGSAVAGDKAYTLTSFSANADRSACVTTTAVSLAGSASVTKTLFTGKAGTKKPTSVKLAVGTKSDETTPTGTDGNWAGTTNSFNGSAFSNGTWTMTIKPALPIAPAVASKELKPIKPMKPVAETTHCKDFDGTVVTFQYP